MWSRMIILHLGYSLLELIDTSNDQYSLLLKKKMIKNGVWINIYASFPTKKNLTIIFAIQSNGDIISSSSSVYILLLSLATSKGALEVNDEFVGLHDDLASTSQTGGARETSFCLICLMKIQHPAALQQKSDICCSWDVKLLSSHWHI